MHESARANSSDQHSAAPKPQAGWICPKCGVVYAPWVASCRCGRPISAGWTPQPSAVPWRFRSTSFPRFS